MYHEKIRKETYQLFALLPNLEECDHSYFPNSNFRKQKWESMLIENQ